MSTDLLNFTRNHQQEDTPGNREQRGSTSFTPIFTSQISTIRLSINSYSSKLIVNFFKRNNVIMLTERNSHDRCPLIASDELLSTSGNLTHRDDKKIIRYTLVFFFLFLKYIASVWGGAPIYVRINRNLRFAFLTFA